ncbi:MAG: hypothetical protein M1812_005323 [Candelaria pacifica]|nr:MAG: hypothetical protein M1812_005323 [Candelaria pacifica]
MVPTTLFTVPQAAEIPGTPINTKRKAPIIKDSRKQHVPTYSFSAGIKRQTSFERSSPSLSPIGSFDNPYPVNDLGPDKYSSDNCCDTMCEEACGGGSCCDDVDCPTEPCAEVACSSSEISPLHSPCAGFVDCDDTDPCTQTDCVAEECREAAPPCFNSDCLEGLIDNPYNPAYTMVTAGLLPTQDSWVTAADEAALNALSGRGSLSSDLEYQFAHTNVLENQPNQSHSRQVSGDLDASEMVWSDNYSYPPAKRRRAFEGDNCIEFDRLALQPPLEQQARPLIDATASPIHCQWGEHCDQSFFDWNALEGHIQSTHIVSQPTVQCHWNGCDEPTHPSMVLNHVKRKHDFEDQHVCLWAGCSQVFNDHRQLEQHLKNAHAPPNSLLCEWDRCGMVADDPFDLREHLQIDHCFDPRFMTLGVEAGNGHSSSAQSHGQDQKACAWTEGDKKNGDVITCGLMFDDPEALHEHIKAAHTDRLNQKLGYFCQWKDCDRRGHGRFSQKGKLERHVQVHTGCMWQPAGLARYKPTNFDLDKPKSNQCSICGLLFSTRQAVQQHERRHTGEKPYRCEICGKTFTAGSSLCTFFKRPGEAHELMAIQQCTEESTRTTNLSNALSQAVINHSTRYGSSTI